MRVFLDLLLLKVVIIIENSTFSNIIIIIIRRLGVLLDDLAFIVLINGRASLNVILVVREVLLNEYFSVLRGLDLRDVPEHEHSPVDDENEPPESEHGRKVIKHVGKPVPELVRNRRFEPGVAAAVCCDVVKPLNCCLSLQVADEDDGNVNNLENSVHDHQNPGIARPGDGVGHQHLLHGFHVPLFLS